MRSYDSTDKYDQKSATELGTEPWMLELLALNPDYNSWGPGEDYMDSPNKPGEHHGWNHSCACKSWTEFGPWGLDELNECVNFHFEISRDSKECTTCGGNGYHPDAHWVTESFYSSSSPFTQMTRDIKDSRAILAQFGCVFKDRLGRGTLPPLELLSRYGKPFIDFCIETINNGGAWNNAITEDEAAALVEAGRGGKVKTAAEFNRANEKGGSFLFDGNHDAINRHILCEARLLRLGIPKNCPECTGHGYIYTAPAPHIQLVLWFLHPRKGCSRGVEVRIVRDDLTAVFKWLREAAQRNADRFSRIPTSTVREITA